MRDEGAGRARELQSGLVQRELLLTVAGLASLSMTYGNLTALVVGGFIVYKSGGVLLRSVDVLLDRAPVGLAEAVRRSVTAVPGVVDAPSVRLRESGSLTLADVVVAVPRTTSAAEAHELTEKVEEAVRGVDARASTLVHVEPVRTEAESAAEAIHATALRMRIRTHHERVWHSGGGLEASLHVEVAPELTLEAAHDLARRLGAALREEYPRLLKVNSHIEVAEPEPGDKREMTTEYPELVEKIGRVVLAAGVEARAHEVRLYRPGGGTAADDESMDAVVHCDFPPATNMGEVHRRTEQVEQTLRTRIPGLGTVVIHAEPREEV